MSELRGTITAADTTTKTITITCKESVAGIRMGDLALIQVEQPPFMIEHVLALDRAMAGAGEAMKTAGKCVKCKERDALEIVEHDALCEKCMAEELAKLREYARSY
jgi:Zn finger protein HypA/HybF involved in hydrogenase expression